MRIDVYRAYLHAHAAAEALLISHTFEDDRHYLGVARDKLRVAMEQLDEIMHPPVEAVAAE